MIKYVTAVQRHCIPVDVFFWMIFNTDAEGDRLVIKGANGNAHVIGWPEIAVAFGSQHDPKEEFRSTKVMQSKLRDLHSDLFLPQAVESNPNKKLVNGQRYEECLYYREAAPYGPTYYLMIIVAELIWCAGRAPRFLTPMVYAYLRSLSGHQTNWAKAILHSLRMEISSLQNRGKTRENQKTRAIMWAPVLLQVVYAFRSTIVAGTPLQEADTWLKWSHMTKDGDMTLSSLVARFPDPIINLQDVRENCLLLEQIPLATPVSCTEIQPYRKGYCRTKITSDIPFLLLTFPFYFAGADMVQILMAFNDYDDIDVAFEIAVFDFFSGGTFLREGLNHGRQVYCVAASDIERAFLQDYPIYLTQQVPETHPLARYVALWKETAAAPSDFEDRSPGLLPEADATSCSDQEAEEDNPESPTGQASPQSREEQEVEVEEQEVEEEEEEEEEDGGGLPEINLAQMAAENQDQQMSAVERNLMEGVNGNGVHEGEDNGQESNRVRAVSSHADLSEEV
ncbi:hypothetical protein R1sor_020396 [Riccia sorocarpa]|uniref:Uncharacterized protein n=1 Tax=Riccia sorocarpa TaxID=122646 RepID=A0ABD3IIL2_9MARC